jgi:hypothetical protein
MVTIAFLRRWLWVRAPPNPNSLFNRTAAESTDRAVRRAINAFRQRRHNQTVEVFVALFLVLLAVLTFVTRIGRTFPRKMLIDSEERWMSKSVVAFRIKRVRRPPRPLPWIELLPTRRVAASRLLEYLSHLAEQNGRMRSAKLGGVRQNNDAPGRGDHLCEH